MSETTTGFIHRGTAWVCTYEHGWWTATDGSNVIKERDLAKLEEAIRKADPNNPRVDAVAFADLVPGIGSTVGLN